MHSQATVRSYTKDRAVLRWDHTLKRGKVKVVSVNQSNTTEILHVGTFAGHIGHFFWSIAARIITIVAVFATYA